MAKKKFTPADLAAQFGLTKDALKVVPPLENEANEAVEEEPFGSSKSKSVGVAERLDKPRDNEIAVYMQLSEVHGHPKNRRLRGEDGLIELAMNIHKIGLLEYPLAWINARGECELLSGHHRYEAYIWLRDNVDAEKYAEIPLRFREDIKSDTDALRILYSANFYNEALLPSEKAESAAFIYNDIDFERKNDASLAGMRSADIAAKRLNTTARTISRLVRIHRNLIDELKGLWDRKIITQSQAEELTKLDQNVQFAFYELIKDREDRLSSQQFAVFLTQTAGEPKEPVNKPKDPNIQLRNYVKSVVKKSREVKQWREMGGTVDKALIDELKTIIRLLEE